MKHHAFAEILIIVALALVTVPAIAEEHLAITVEARVLAADREAAATAITVWAEGVGGYFTLRTGDQVVIRVPNDTIDDLRGFLEELGVAVLSYNPAARDLREDLFRAEAGITGHSESIDQILEFLDGSDVPATLSLERELRNLLDDLESYLGRRRRIVVDSTFARATVYLSSRQESIPQQLSSSFEWINTVDLYRFLKRVER